MTSAMKSWQRVSVDLLVENNVMPMEVHDDRYGSVKSWPSEAWKAVHDVNLAKLF